MLDFNLLHNNKEVSRELAGAIETRLVVIRQIVASVSEIIPVTPTDQREAETTPEVLKYVIDSADNSTEMATTPELSQQPHILSIDSARAALLEAYNGQPA